MLRCLVLLSLFHLPAPVFSQQDIVINGLQEVVYPINSSDLGFKQWDGLKSLFRSKEIVGMGEATHGTHEFFKTKIEVFQFLVKECDYRVFGIEASYGAEMYVNNYVRSGMGNINEVMKYLDWPWGTKEVKDLVEWIRDYNRGKDEKDQISFYGFDMQNVSFGIKNISQFLSTDSSDFSVTFRRLAPLLTVKSELGVLQFINKEKQIAKDSLYAIHEKLKDWIEMNKAKISEKYGNKEWHRFSLSIENYNQSLQFIYGGNRSFSFRDSCMAHNVLEIQKIENRKMFIWGHNDHIGLEYHKIPIMGTYLKRSLEEEYYAVGFAFDQGTFMAFKGPNTITGAVFKFLFNRKRLYQGLIECTAEASKRNTLTTELKKSPTPNYFIDVNSTSNTFFQTPRYYYDVGATYLNHKRASNRIVVKDQFDGLIFFTSTRATTILEN